MNVITSQDDLEIQIYNEDGIVISENWKFIQSLEITDSPQFITAEQSGSSIRRKLRIGANYRMTVSQIESDGGGIWDLSNSNDLYSVFLYSDQLFKYLGGLDVIKIPQGTNYVQLLDCHLGEKRRSVHKTGNMFSLTLEAQEIGWDEQSIISNPTGVWDTLSDEWDDIYTMNINWEDVGAGGGEQQ